MGRIRKRRQLKKILEKLSEKEEIKEEEIKEFKAEEEEF